MDQYAYQDEIDLRDLIRTIWRGRWVIILAVCCAVLGAVMYTYLRIPSYEASISLLAPDYPLSDGTVLRQADYLPLFRKESIAESLVRKHGNNSSDTESAISNLISKTKVKSENESSVVVTSLRHDDRLVLIEMLRDYAELVQAEITSFASSINDNYIQRLEATLSDRRSAYQKALEDLREFQRTTDPDGLKSALLDKQSRLRSTEARIDSLGSSISALSAAIEQATRQLDSTEMLIVTRDTLDEAGLNLVHQIGGNDLTVAPTIEREQLNPVYTELVAVLHSSQVELDSKRAEMETLVDQASTLREEIESIRQAYADAEKADAELRLAVEHALDSFEKARAALSQAKSIAENTRYAVTVESGPWAPTSPVGPGKLVTIALAAILAGFVSVFAVLFADYMRTDAGQPTASTRTRQGLSDAQLSSS